VDEFAQALRSVGEPIFGHSAEDISMARLLSHLFDVTERFGMETRTELILLQRTMVVVEGVSRSLDPVSLDIWDAAKPEVERYITENLGPRAFVRDLIKTAQSLSRFGPQLPQIIESILASQVVKKPDKKIYSIQNKLMWAAMGSIVTLGSVLLLGFF
jgi:ubiquinone biosynthesis protein